MSQNPYANPYPQQYAQPGYPPAFGGGPPARTSVMAVLSLIFSLLCCTAPLGVIFGGLALLAIAFSGGKVKGVGLAIAGLILGIIITVVGVGVMWGSVAGLNMMAQPASNTITAIEQSDGDTARAAFTPTAQATLTDERVDEFRDVLASDLGSFDSLPSGVGDWWSGYIGAFSTPAAQQAMQTAQNRYNDDVVPLPVRFDDQWTLVLVVLDQTGSASSQGMPLYRDLGIVRDDGSIEWLVAGNDGGANLPNFTPPRPLGSPDEDPDAEDPDAEDPDAEDPGAEPTGEPAPEEERPTGLNRRPKP